jgi:hypothetical protein
VLVTARRSRLAAKAYSATIVCASLLFSVIMACPSAASRHRPTVAPQNAPCAQLEVREQLSVSFINETTREGPPISAAPT